MCCLSDCKPHLPFVINLFCASYSLALLDNGISLKVIDMQQEESTSTNCPNSLHPPASSLCHTVWFYWQLSPSPSASFWCISAVSCLAYCDFMNQSPALPRGKCFPDILQTHLHCFALLPFGSFLFGPVIQVYCSSFADTCKTGRDSSLWTYGWGWDTGAFHLWAIKWTLGVLPSVEINQCCNLMSVLKYINKFWIPSIVQHATTSQFLVGGMKALIKGEKWPLSASCRWDVGA